MTNFENLAGPLKQGIGTVNQRKSLVIRLMVGAWVLSCFVLITAYSSVLISFVTAPDNLKPIIDSFEDLPKNPKIHITTKKSYGIDKTIQVIILSPTSISNSD